MTKKTTDRDLAHAERVYNEHPEDREYRLKKARLRKQGKRITCPPQTVVVNRKKHKTINGL